MVECIVAACKHKIPRFCHRSHILFLLMDGHQVYRTYHHLTMVVFFAHLITNSETIAENQRNTSIDTYRAGAMKHKERGYRLFRDDHVKMVRFHPGDSSANQCIFYAQGKPSMKIIGCYSTVVTLSKSTGYVIGAHRKCKAGAGGCCKHVAALLYNILDYVELGLAAIPEDKTCTDKPQRWNRPKTSASIGPILFPSKLQILVRSSILSMPGWVQVQMDWSRIPILLTLMACWRSSAHTSSETLPHLKQLLKKDFVVCLKTILSY